MSRLHLFISENSFHSESDFDQFILPVYDEDGEFVESNFMIEIGFEVYEPMCIVRVFAESPTEVKNILQGASYSDQWLDLVNIGKLVKTAVAVYEPNLISNPQNSSIEYVGSFNYSDA